MLLQKQNKNKNIILCENKKNFLKSLGNKLKAEIFEHKNYIGGRYSVLSEVGEAAVLSSIVQSVMVGLLL